jgi:hypothetical protein
MRPSARTIWRPVRKGIGLSVWELKTIIAEHPSIAVPLARIRGHGQVVQDGVEIVMEAFVRSGLSYAVAAFRLAEGVRRGLPSLLLIRPPEDTVTSYAIKTPDTTVGGGLRGYVRFHDPLLRYRSGLVVGTFEQVTGDFGSVIVRVNDRFGTDFRPFEATEANVARIFREIEDDWRSRATTEEERERGVPRPSQARAEMKAQLLERYHRPALTRQRQRAENAYETFAEMAGS